VNAAPYTPPVGPWHIVRHSKPQASGLDWFLVRRVGPASSSHYEQDRDETGAVRCFGSELAAANRLSALERTA